MTCHGITFDFKLELINLRVFVFDSNLLIHNPRVWDFCTLKVFCVRRAYWGNIKFNWCVSNENLIFQVLVLHWRIEKDEIVGLGCGIERFDLLLTTWPTISLSSFGPCFRARLWNRLVFFMLTKLRLSIDTDTYLFLDFRSFRILLRLIRQHHNVLWNNVGIIVAIGVAEMVKRQGILYLAWRRLSESRLCLLGWMVIFMAAVTPPLSGFSQKPLLQTNQLRWLWRSL